MESPTDKIKLFNSILESFLAQSAPLLGTTYHFYFTKLIKVNASLPINHAIHHLLIHKNQIINKDETYFVDKDVYNDNIKNIDSGNQQISDETLLSEILRLKDIYYQFNDESKEHIWSILQSLLQLTIEYKELKNL